MPKITLSFKGRILSVHYLQEGRTLVGRDPDCAICIESLAVAPHHAELTTMGRDCSVRALDIDHPVTVNGQRVDEAALSYGDEILVGKHHLGFTPDEVALVPAEQAAAEAVPVEESAPPDTGADTPEPPAGAAYVQILSGSHIGRVIPLNRSLIRLGKTGGNCAMIVQRGGGYYLSYLEGKAPSVDGVSIGEDSVLLVSGSLIQVGDTRLQFFG